MLELEKAGVKISSRGGNLFRAVTHRMISANDIDEAIKAISTICRKTG
jgi:threonine aldolase